MSRPRIPTSTLANRGSFIHNPDRLEARANEPTPTGELGEPPASLTHLQKSIWLELAALIPPGVAGNCDRWIVEIAVKLMSKVRRGVAKGVEVSQLLACLSRMGMTPADRSRVKANIAADLEKSDWDDLDEKSEQVQ
jgi:hypothetical protein